MAAHVQGERWPVLLLSYKASNVSKRSNLKHFVLLITYEWTHASVIVINLERCAWDKSLRIIGPILLSCEENEVL